MANPQSMLDVGFGYGQYGFLAREYLELWDQQEQYERHARRIDGIEVFPQYVTAHHKLIYDHLYIGDALEILPTLDIRYDLIAAIDILEHFDYECGLKFLRACAARAQTVVISTPFYVGEQGALFGNPYETHRFQWERRHFRAFPNCFFAPHDASLLVCFGEGAPRIRAGLRYRHWKPRLKRCFPSLVSLLLALKGRRP